MFGKEDDCTFSKEVVGMLGAEGEGGGERVRKRIMKR